MATVTPTILKARATSLASLSDSVCQAAIDEAYLELDEDVWGAKLDAGAFYLAAHKATVGSLRGGSAGAIQSESVGSVSRSFAVSQSAAASDLLSTAYGAEYARLVGTLVDARLGVIMGTA